MAFKRSDFKKTTRKSNGTRQIYPYQIRDSRYTAAIGYAIAYYERMIGCRRAEFESDTLLEFFGDPRLARGLVACLGRTYVWRTRTFSEVFGNETAQALRKAGIATAIDMRTRLYGLANGRYGGCILPHERVEALEYLCERLAGESCRITSAQIEQALTLDAEDERVLVKYGATPTPEQIIALYNYHSIETALCHAEWVRLHLHGPIWSIIRSAHNLARRYRLRYQVGELPRTLFDQELDLTFPGGRDGLGSWTRTGRRVVRALLRLLATHPDSLTEGEALVHIGGQPARLRLDERALHVLGVVAREQPPESEAWDDDIAELFRRAWARAFMAGRTAGWRLRRDPEPLIAAGTMVVPDFVLLRGNERLAISIASGQAAADALMRDFARLGRIAPVAAVMPAGIAEQLRSCPAPLATYTEQPSEAVSALVAILDRTNPRTQTAPHAPRQSLERMIAEDGFVAEKTVAEVLGCKTSEVAQAVRRWEGIHVLPGLGICAPDALDDIRQMLEQNNRVVVTPGI